MENIQNKFAYIKTYSYICINQSIKTNTHMTKVSNEEQSNNANVLLVAVADMLQYSETQWVTSCDNCGDEHWFELPQDGDKCEYCDYVYQQSSDKKLHKDIVDMLKYGQSDAYIEAKLYGKYKYKFSMKDINNMIDKAKEHLSKSEGNF